MFSTKSTIHRFSCDRLKSFALFVSSVGIREASVATPPIYPFSLLDALWWGGCGAELCRSAAEGLPSPDSHVNFRVIVRAGDIECAKEIISTFSGLRLRAASRSLVEQSVRLGHEDRFQ